MHKYVSVSPMPFSTPEEFPFIEIMLCFLRLETFICFNSWRQTEQPGRIPNDSLHCLHHHFENLPCYSYLLWRWLKLLFMLGCYHPSKSSGLLEEKLEHLKLRPCVSCFCLSWQRVHFLVHAKCTKYSLGLEDTGYVSTVLMDLSVGGIPSQPNP